MLKQGLGYVDKVLVVASEDGWVVVDELGEDFREGIQGEESGEREGATGVVEVAGGRR